MEVIYIPLISQFYGILVYIYKELGGHHNEPHIHIKYNEFEMSMSIKGKVLDGRLPNKQMKLVEAWYEIHQDELRAAYYSYNENGEVIKIKGLE